MQNERFSPVTNSYFHYVFHIRNKVFNFKINTQKISQCHTVFETTSYTTKHGTAPKRTKDETQQTPTAHSLRARPQHKKNFTTPPEGARAAE